MFISQKTILSVIFCIKILLNWQNIIGKDITIGAFPPVVSRSEKWYLSPTPNYDGCGFGGGLYILTRLYLLTSVYRFLGVVLYAYQGSDQ